MALKRILELVNFYYYLKKRDNKLNYDYGKRNSNTIISLIFPLGWKIL